MVPEDAKTTMAVEPKKAEEVMVPERADGHQVEARTWDASKAQVSRRAKSAWSQSHPQESTATIRDGARQPLQMGDERRVLRVLDLVVQPALPRCGYQPVLLQSAGRGNFSEANLRP